MIPCEHCERLAERWPTVEAYGSVTFQRDELRCAFELKSEQFVFTNDNWNCGMMNALAETALNTPDGTSYISANDEHYFTIPFDDFSVEGDERRDFSSGVVVLSRYKNRGRMQAACVLFSEGAFGTLTLDLALHVIRTYAARKT